MLCSAWSISYEEPREASSFPTIAFAFCRRVFQRPSFLLKDVTRRENHRGICLSECQTFRQYPASLSLVLRFVHLCNASVYRILVSRANVGQFHNAMSWRSSEISSIVSRRAILPTPLMKIAKVQNRYSNYPNKKD